MTPLFSLIIRPFTRNLMKSHGRRSFTTWLPQRSSLLLSAYKPVASNKRIFRGFHTSPPTISTHTEPEALEGRSHPTWMNNLRDLESSWMSINLEMEELMSQTVSAVMSRLSTAEKMKDDVMKEEKQLTDAMCSGLCKCAAEWLPKVLERKLEISNFIATEISDLEIRKSSQSSVREGISLIKLRTELFLPFRVAVKRILEPRLSAKPKKIQGAKGNNFVLNLFNADRDSDYSLFLKQFKLDLESGNLNSFLSGLGIENAREFYEICEFAIKGDQEAFRRVHQFWIYYMEEEVSECDGQFEFHREGILELIGKVKYSESLPKNCVKMVDYLSKLI